MNRNVSNTDRLIRVVAAVVALILAFAVFGASSVVGIILIVVAVVLAGTAAVGFCPLYRVFGINTCRVKNRPKRTGGRTDPACSARTLGSCPRSCW